MIREIVVTTKGINGARGLFKFTEDKVDRLGCNTAGIKQVTKDPNGFNFLILRNLPNGLNVCGLGCYPIFIGTAPGSGATNMPIGCDAYLQFQTPLYEKHTEIPVHIYGAVATVTVRSSNFKFPILVLLYFN
jgi:hypothetical protein